MRYLSRWLFSAAVVLSPVGRVFAGSVISSGLPANTAIVNISGTADGAARYDLSNFQTYWFSPFSTSGTLLEYTVQPGTYTFRAVNAADAASLYPVLTAAQLAQIYTAWTYNSPWVTDYLVFDSSAVTNSSEYQLFAGAVTPVADYPGFADANTAYNTAKTSGYFNQIVSGVGGRHGGTVSNTYTFSSAETLIFSVPDYLLSDNAGGVSVLISPTAASRTPEPASFLLIAVGVLAIPLLGHRLRTR
jgi:hypothetical protein